MDQQNKNIFLSVLYFLLATVFTSVFIVFKFWLYPSVTMMIISGAIAGSKWLIQITAALLTLGEKKWVFVKRIGFVCFVGSCLLFSYNLMGLIPLPFSGFTQFITAVAIAILGMMFLYFRAVRATGLSLNWFFGWLVCLAVAVLLQITIVFKS